MKPSRKTLPVIVLLLICLIIKWFSADSDRVERLYSTQFFASFASNLRKGLGGWSLSMGDILYGCLAGWFLYKIFRLILFTFRNKQPVFLKATLLKNLRMVVVAVCIVYIVFNIFWGINYNRKGIAYQLGLATLTYDTSDLNEMNGLLIEKLNASKQVLLATHQPYPSSKDLFEGVRKAYAALGKNYPFLQYKNESLKSSSWGWFGNYAGFTGYYNPFTGEAQVNTTVPKFLQPFISCHEVAHQLGYAKEMEANFVGYLAATSSTDPLFQYSVYLDLFNYANRNLFITDSAAAKGYRNKLIPPVKEDIREWIRFNQRNRSLLEPVVRWGYGLFLQSNEQPQGILSYDEVTGFLIAYYKKIGKI